MPQAFAEKVDQSNPSDSIGLTSQEAQERLRRFGANDPAPARRHSVLTELLFLFVNPLGIILLIAAVISGFIGQLLDAGIIVAMVLVGAGINFLPNLPVENRHREPESKGRTHSYRSTGRSLAGNGPKETGSGRHDPALRRRSDSFRCTSRRFRPCI